MTNFIKIILLLFIPISMQSQQSKKLSKSKVDYTSFLELSEEILDYRQERLIPLETFLEYASEENTIVLDTRSETAFKQKHLKGAMHINFSDFTDKKLAKKIPLKDTRILIYCNNNIDGDRIHFASKKTPLALNIPTFINLYGYGYKNVYELSSLVPIKDQRLQFEGTSVK
ncbi:rhodanese-like domain-containing protein [Aquimarina mytili]|uniref:Rhodanese-like domain-containing protein n=2 Tax=Aquimarina mytili TaxID=874423 RepID=A0A937D9F2_9FLAO|nr:rhodanese-like domain-containing protein [Aquimarina mytili]